MLITACKADCGHGQHRCRWTGSVSCGGLPIIGWIITLVAMRSCPLTKEEMVNVQKRIAEKKAAAQSEFYKEQLQ